MVGLQSILTFLELVAGLIVAISAISAAAWWLFGNKVKTFIRCISEELDKKQSQKLMAEIKKLMKDVETIIERLDKNEKDSMIVRGYSILRACKESLDKGFMGELEYQQLDLIYKSYTHDKGNGAVKKIWRQLS